MVLMPWVWKQLQAKCVIREDIDLHPKLSNQKFFYPSKIDTFKSNTTNFGKIGNPARKVITLYRHLCTVQSLLVICWILINLSYLIMSFYVLS